MLVLFFAFALNSFHIFGSVTSIDSEDDDPYLSQPITPRHILPEVLEVSESTFSLDELNLDPSDDKLTRQHTSVFCKSDSDIFNSGPFLPLPPDSSSENGCSTSYSILEFGNSPAHIKEKAITIQPKEHVLSMLTKCQNLKTRSCRVLSSSNPLQFFMVAICNHSEAPTIKDLVEDFMHQRFFLNTNGIHAFCQVVSWCKDTDLYYVSINEEGKNRLKLMYSHLKSTNTMIASVFYSNFIKFFSEYP